VRATIAPVTDISLVQDATTSPAASPPASQPMLASDEVVAPDAVLAAAVDVARAAAVETAGVDQVGEHDGVAADGERIVTHFFASTDRAYVGWRWAVTLARAPRSKTATVDEVVLLPGPGSLLAPEWVPWSRRLQAGDLGVGDVLPTAAEDERLVPGYAALPPHGEGAETLDDDEADADFLALVDELWLGRPRVLSIEGRELAAQRWYDADQGPSAPIARAAELPCASCGFLVLLRGALSRAFGVCANEFAPDDGRVVSFDHGCGAHSEALVVHTAPVAPELPAVSDVDEPVEPVEALVEPVAERDVESVEPEAD
jgi:hypothetical protein